MILHDPVEEREQVLGENTICLEEMSIVLLVVVV